jgi:peroxiredoxin
MPRFGEPAPLFTAPSGTAERYNIGVAGGRWIVLMIFGTLDYAASMEALALAMRHRDNFNDIDAAFFGVSMDPADRDQRGIVNSEPGVRFFWDFESAIGKLYGVADDSGLRPTVFLIDPSLRIVMSEPIAHTATVIDRLNQELAKTSVAPGAPILIMPRVFEPELCRILISYFEGGGSTESGFTEDVGGRTLYRTDARLKRRRDVTISHDEMIEAVRTRLEDRLFPMIKRFFGWQATHIERYLICRYDEADNGFFMAHRDDTTLGTAHRKFAVSINLNAEEFDGGDLRFPEFGRQTYRPPTGGAAVFSCSMLHEAVPVTRGQRYVVVPFLYDDEGERLREANLGFVG